MFMQTLVARLLYVGKLAAIQKNVHLKFTMPTVRSFIVVVLLAQAYLIHLYAMEATAPTNMVRLAL